MRAREMPRPFTRLAPTEFRQKPANCRIDTALLVLIFHFACATITLLLEARWTNWTTSGGWLVVRGIRSTYRRRTFAWCSSSSLEMNSIALSISCPRKPLDSARWTSDRTRLMLMSAGSFKARLRSRCSCRCSCGTFRRRRDNTARASGYNRR